MPIFLRLAKPVKEPQRLPAVFPSVPAPPDVSAPMFAAPRSIVINDAPAMPGPDGKPPPPGAAQASSARAAYAGAVARTASLYATMIAAARSLQADAMAEQERLARTQEGGLLRDLDQLEAGLRCRCTAAMPSVRAPS